MTDTPYLIKKHLRYLKKVGSGKKKQIASVNVLKTIKRKMGRNQELTDKENDLVFRLKYLNMKYR